MKRNEYNGWTNYETWAVALWIDNEEGSKAEWQERITALIQHCRGSQYMTVEQVIERTLADALEEAHEEHVESLEIKGFAADLLNASLSEVNWHEIAKGLLAD